MSNEYIYDRAAVNLYGEKDAYTALFYKSCSSNIDPLTPRWWLYSFKRKAEAMNRVLEHVHYCDGGMTRGPKGIGLTSVAEIGRWRNAIACATSPSPGLTTTIRFVPTSDSLYESSFEDLKAVSQLAKSEAIELDVNEILDIQGVRSGADLILDLANPKVIDFLFSICGNGSDLAQYKRSSGFLLTANEIFRNLASHLGFRNGAGLWADKKAAEVTRCKAVSKTEYSIFKFHLTMFVDQPEYSEDLFVAVDRAGKVHYGGTDPHGWFCRKELSALEQQHPGCAEHAYESFKKQVKNLPISDLTEFHVTMAKPDPGEVGRWWFDAVSRLKAESELACDERYQMEGLNKARALKLSDVIDCDMEDLRVGANSVAEEQRELFA